MIVLEELTRVYGKFTALDKLSMTIAEGELHGFVGPNGAGKTTTMRILATLLPASGGRATIDGVDVAKNPRRVRTLVGYMPDFFGVYDSLKAWEYLDFYGRLYGLSAARRRERVDQLLELVRLSDKRDSYVDSLSRGMKQRLCLAHSLIHDPRLLILDEPASGMDPRARAEMKDILRALRDMKKTVLISSHILPELSEMCDSLTIIDHGKLVFTGSVEALDRKMNGDAPIDIRFAPGAGEESVDAAVALLKQYPGVSGITPGGRAHAARGNFRPTGGHGRAPARAHRGRRAGGGFPPRAHEPGKGVYGGDPGMLINPILASSARRRMRSWKTPLILLLFGAALLGIAFVTALMPLMGESMTISSARNGLDSYIVLVCAEFALIVLVAPAMTAGSIAGERERQTLEMLLVTNTALSASPWASCWRAWAIWRF